MDRSQITDAGFLAVIKTVLSKSVDQLDAGEKNFVREHKELFSEEELAPFASLFGEVAPAEEKEVEEAKEEVEADKEQEEETDSKNGGTDTEPMTDEEIKSVLTNRGVKFRSNVTRATLLKLLKEQEAE